MVDPPKKLIIVGEKVTGKTSLIKVFKEYDGPGTCSDTFDNKSKSQNYNTTASSITANKKQISSFGSGRGSSNRKDKRRDSDFSLKILRINGKKMRV